MICDFHREQAWERWIAKKSNDCVEERGKILPLLRQLAKSLSEEDYNNGLNNLRDSTYWKDEKFDKLKNYLNQYWLNIKEVRTSANK